MDIQHIKLHYMQHKQSYYLLAPFILFLLWVSITQFVSYNEAPYILTERVYADDSSPTQTHLYKTNLRYETGQHSLIAIRTDGCIRALSVNGSSVAIPTPHPTPGYPRRCRGPNAINLDLEPYLYHALNVLYVEVTPVRETSILRVSTNYAPMHVWFYTLLWLAIISAALIGFARRYRMDDLTVIACVFAVFLYLLQLFSADFIDRSNDLRGHMYYIMHVADNWSLPPPRTPQLQQPPLYYFVSAITVSINRLIGMTTAGIALKMQSLLLFLGFTAFGLLTLRRIFKTPSLYYYIAAAIFLFWPHNFVMASKVNNDILLYAFGAAILHFLICWQQERKAHYLALSIVLCGLSVMTKSTGLLFCAITLIGIIYHVAITKRLPMNTLFSRPFLQSYVLFIFCAGLNFGRIVYFQSTSISDISLLSTPVLLGTIFEVPNDITYFTQMDIAHFFNQPFMSAFSASREYFWNYLFKTLLFGEWTDWTQSGVAILLASLLLIINCYLVVMTIYHLCTGKQTIDKIILPAISCFIFVIGLMYFRYHIPAAPSNNARYIYNIILPLALLSGIYLQWHQQQNHKLLSVLTTSVAISFILACLVFNIANIADSVTYQTVSFRFGNHVI